MATFFRYLLMFVEAVTCLMLIGVILVQRTKSQGLGMAMGGQMGEALFGARMGNVLTRVTVVLGIIFLVNTTLLAYLGATSSSGSVTDGALPAAVPAAAMPAPPSAPPLDVPLDAVPSGDVTPVDAGGAAMAPVSASAPVEPIVIPPAVEPVTAEPVTAP